MAMTDVWKLNWGGQKVEDATNGVHLGALVTISPDASFWSGAKVERWYYLKKWYVTEMNGNKVKLGRDESGKYTIRLPISTRYLTVVKEAVQENE